MKKIQITKYKGDETCHVRKIGAHGGRGVGRKCTNKAEYNIGGGKLRCRRHFTKYLNKKIRTDINGDFFKKYLDRKFLNQEQ